ncbi:MAG: bile acid:sodium symporter family protein [Brevinema sp.]
MSALKIFNKRLTRLMPLIVVVTAVGSLLAPKAFGIIKPSYLTNLLIATMLCMSLTLKPQDFKVVLSRPRDIFIAGIIQFSVMPFLAYALIKSFNLPLELAVGVVLVGTCPGGVSSNIITYLAKGDVALSVAATAVSTLLAPFLTPLLTLLLIGQRVEVNVVGMILTVVRIVLFPLIIGFSIRALFPKIAKAIEDFLPGISVAAMMAMLAAIVASNAQNLLGTAGLVIVSVVFIHNVLGYIVGYFCAKKLGLTESKSVAVSIESGMQNTSLAITLAATHYAALPLATLPGAIFSIMHSITGAIAASIFASRKNPKVSIAETPIPVSD